MALEGFGSELSIGAIIVLALKVLRDFVKERKEKQHAVKVINGGNRGNPGNHGLSRGDTSTNIVLHVLEEHGQKLDKLDGDVHKLEEEMTNVRIELAGVRTKVNMKEEKL